MGIIEDVKEAVKLSQQVNNVDLYRKLVDLQLEVIELTERLKEKNNTIEKLKTAFELKGKMICIESVYWLKDENDKTKDGPFCSKCFEVDHIQCHLARLPQDFRPGLKCPNCKAKYESCLGFDYIDKQFRSGHDRVF
ncbi:MAG: hypothetical protein ACYSYV_10775 [Planctomycetota bacterium]|jgi:hypothetical protein